MKCEGNRAKERSFYSPGLEIQSVDKNRVQTSIEKLTKLVTNIEPIIHR